MRITKSKVLAVTAGLLAFGVVGASAATLGGLNSQRVGASDTVVVSGDSDGVGLTYVTSFDAPSGEYKVTGVTLTDIENPTGDKINVALQDDAKTVLSTATGVVSGTSQTMTLSAPVSAKSVTHAAVVISG